MKVMRGRSGDHKKKAGVAEGREKEEGGRGGGPEGGTRTGEFFVLSIVNTK